MQIIKNITSVVFVNALLMLTKCYQKYEYNIVYLATSIGKRYRICAGWNKFISYKIGHSIKYLNYEK